MDAVNRVVNAASTALWGESSARSEQSNVPHGEEPIAGVQGKGVATDPYDAGNREEQPEAPPTDENTAIQEPQLTGQPLNPNTAVTLKMTDEPALSTSNADTQTPTSAEASSSGISTVNEVRESKPSSSAEQRNTEETEGESSSAQSTAANDHRSQQVSKEALKGPQGPAPHPAEEFEKELKGNGPVFRDVDYGPSNTTKESSHSEDKSPQGSNSGSGSGKHSTMAKMKERLNRVTHPRNGHKQKGTAE